MREPRELINTQQSLDLVRPVPAFDPLPSTYSNTDDDAHLRDYWRAVRKRLWLVIGITILATMLAAIYMARKPDIFEAQSLVQVDLENTNPAFGASRDGSVIVGSPINDPAYFNTQLQILTSAGLLRRVAKTLDLEHNQAFLRPQSSQSRSTWQSLQRLVGLGGGNEAGEKSRAKEQVLLTSSVAPATSRQDLAEAKRLAPYVGALQSGLKVAPVKESRAGSNRETRLIDIRFTHPDPQIAAKVVNTIGDTFVLSNLEKKTETNTSAGDFLQKSVAELQARIRNGEEQLINYAKNHEILSLDASQNTVVDRLAGLNRQLLEAENERKLAEAAYRASLAPGAAIALAEDATHKQVAETKLAELRQRRAQLLVENTEEWPEVKEVNQQIAVLENQVREARHRAVSVLTTNLETRYRQTLAREDALRTSFNHQRAETLTQNEAAISYRIIQQEIETNKNLLNGLLQRFRENEVVLAQTPNNVHVVDYAIAPETPVGPRRLRGVLMAFFLSVAFGVGLVLLLEYLDDTLRSADDVEEMLRLPALAVIPSISSPTRRRLLSAAAGPNQNGHGPPELLVHTDACSPAAEAYRQLRTSVLLSTAGGAPKTLLITSTLPTEGKTTTAVNTAMSLVQTGATVLIIDGDMRRPRLHSIFEVENRCGLSTALSSEMSDAEALGMIVQHEASSLYVLTSGPVPPNPAELIASEQMRRLITTFERTFTHIIIDSPPIISFTDGVLIASMVDGVLLIVHGGKSSRAVVRRGRQSLHGVGAKILGVVLNNVNQRPHDYYYYQRYYHQSYAKAEAGTADTLASTHSAYIDKTHNPSY